MKFSECSKNQQWVIKTMQALGYGELCGLQAENGEPQRMPAPELWRTEKFGFNKHLPVKRITGDFELHKQHVHFLKYLKKLENGVIPIIQIHDGLPLIHKRKVFLG